MRVSLTAKQTAAVTALIALSMTALSTEHLASLGHVGLEDSQRNGELLGRIIYQKARDAVAGAEDPVVALSTDPGIRSILESTAVYGRNVTYAAIVDNQGTSVAHSFRGLEGRKLEPQESLSEVLSRSTRAQIRAIYDDRTLEIILPLQLGDAPFGAIRIGLSPVLIRNDLSAALGPMLWTTLLISTVSLAIGLVLTRRVLRPIHVINSGLMRLGRGETGVTIELPPDKELKGLGDAFKAVGDQLAARAPIDPLARIESFVEQLEDAVAILNARGSLLFANSAMRAMLPEADTSNPFSALPVDHPYRRLADEALHSGRSQGPVTATIGSLGEGGAIEDRAITAHVIRDVEREPIGVMLVSRNRAYLTQVRSTIEYAQKLASLGRLMAGVTHEVKNPLNAMTIHLELVREHLTRAAEQRGVGVGAALSLAAARQSTPVRAFSGPSDGRGACVDDPWKPIEDAREHVEVIAAEIRRLDEVIQGFLRFIRPEELQLQIIDVQALMGEVLALVEPDARRTGVVCRVKTSSALPELRADPALVRQALLNLALNACQAMPKGGELRMSCREEKDGRIGLLIEDTGVGIPRAQLDRIFDLYYTTKSGGSGIGLSMVYRIAQLHGGEITVESTEGRGTTFRLLLPRA
jgi:signal transduction histidine kinase